MQSQSLCDKIEALEKRIEQLEKFVGCNATSRGYHITESNGEAEEDNNPDDGYSPAPFIEGRCVIRSAPEGDNEEGVLYFGGFRAGKSRWLHSESKAKRFDTSEDAAALIRQKRLKPPGEFYEIPSVCFIVEDDE